MFISKVDTLLESIRKLTRRGAYHNVKNILEKLHAADVAYLFRYLNEGEQHKVFGLIADSEMASEILSQVDSPTSARILTKLEREKAAEILHGMDPDDKVSILEGITEEVRDDILAHLSESDAESIEEMFQYPEDSAGRIMNTNYFALQEDVTVSDAISELQKKGADATEMVFYIYVVDSRNHLIGVCSLRQLLLVPPSSTVMSVMAHDVVSVSAETDQEDVARLVEKYDFLAVPVTDDENKLLGIVTVDDVIDVIRHEATEDIMKMVGTGDEYLNRSVFRRARMRMPWMLAAFVGEIIGIQFLNIYNVTLEKIVALALFLPIIIAMGGNIGATSMTIVVRGLATGRIAVKELRVVILKELYVALILGVLYGLMLAALAYFQFGEVNYLGFVVGMSLLISMLMAAAIGTLVPILLHLMKIDPAVATGPFVTSTVDSLGILIYMALATAILL
ncbi:MAG: magnesium transporter [bacterium]|nr:magnesium transporter [bacterium]MDT8365772.1 magnesium transporter [bacterium]